MILKVKDGKLVIEVSLGSEDAIQFSTEFSVKEVESLLKQKEGRLGYVSANENKAGLLIDDLQWRLSEADQLIDELRWGEDL